MIGDWTEEPDSPETISMRKTQRRSRRGPAFGWETAHARLEDRLLLSATPVELASPSPAHGESGGGPASASASSPTRDDAGGFVIVMDSAGVSGLTADARASHGGIDPPSFAFAPSNFFDSGSPEPQAVVDSGVGSPQSFPTAPAAGVTGALPGPGAMPPGPAFGPSALVAWMSDAEHGDGPGGPPMIGGDPIGPRAPGIEGTVLQRMEDHYPGFQAVDAAALGILPSDPSSPCASMASIVGNVEAEVVVLAPAAAPVVSTGVLVALPAVSKVDDAPVASPPLFGMAGETDGGAAAPAPVPTAPALAPDPPTESSSSGEGSEPEDLPAPISLGLRLTAPFLDATGWDEALGQLVGGVDDLLGGLEDLGGEPGYLPWVVAAGVAVTATEVARRARTRPGFAAAFVGGSVEAVDPADVPRGRTRGAMLSDSVRRLLARGMSRWTTRR